MVGTASVQATFPMSTFSKKLARLGPEELPAGGPRIAGVRVTQGQLKRASSFVRVMRGGQEVFRVGAACLQPGALVPAQLGPGAGVPGAGAWCLQLLDRIL